MAAPMPISTDPVMLWWCARYMRRLRIVSRIERMTTIGHLAIAGAALAVAGALVDWPAARELVVSSVGPWTLPWIVAMPAAMVMAGAALWVLRWREEGPES